MFSDNLLKVYCFVPTWRVVLYNDDIVRIYSIHTFNQRRRYEIYVSSLQPVCSIKNTVKSTVYIIPGSKETFEYHAVIHVIIYELFKLTSPENFVSLTSSLEVYSVSLNTFAFSIGVLRQFQLDEHKIILS